LRFVVPIAIASRVQNQLDDDDDNQSDQQRHLSGIRHQAISLAIRRTELRKRFPAAKAPVDKNSGFFRPSS
jgi:hypothetical protein